MAMYREIGDFILRDWRMEDALSIARYGNNRKIWLNLRDGFPNPYTIRDAEAYIRRANETEPRAVFAVATASEAIGSIGLMLGADVHRFSAEIGYWLAEPFWGRGIMTNAVKSMMLYAIHELKLNRISAAPYATNPASARVLEKAGFSREGILRSSVYKNGKVLDQFLYSYITTKNTQLYL